MADAKLLKDLQIKVNTVKRLVKEHAYYQKEAEKSAEKIEKMKNDAEIDPYDVKKAQEVLQVNLPTASQLPSTLSIPQICHFRRPARWSRTWRRRSRRLRRS